MDSEVKKWLFFEKDEWSQESQKFFKEQFDQELFKKLQANITNLNNKISEKKNNKILEQKASRLNGMKSSTTATLHFYLEESDPEPFLTTEVTIPFPSEFAVIPSPTPAP